MHRISPIEEYWNITPSVSDFVAYDAQILLNRLLIMYIVKNNKVEMLHLHNIEKLSGKSNLELNLIDSSCNLINAIPNDCWTKVSQALEFASK